MELQLYLDILKRRALVIVIVAAVAVSVVTAAGFLVPPVYSARATVRVLLDVGVADFILREDYNKRLLNTYVQVLKSEPILDEAISRLSPRTPLFTVENLGENVEVEVIPDTELISIVVQDSNPEVARILANTLATLLTEYAQDLYVGSSKSTRQIVEEQLAGMANDLEEDRQRLSTWLAEGRGSAEVEALKSQIQFKEDAYDRLLDRYELARLNESLRANSITIISPARAPKVPTNALGLTDIGIAFMVGLLGGIGLALVLENLDTAIHSPQQLERLTGLPLLGAVPKGLLSLGDLNHANGSGANKPIEEAYRLLGINLQALGEGAPLRTILITSAMPKEGKSTTVANLAQVLAERGQTVFLVESDLRRPTVARMLDIQGERPGLGGLLTRHSPLSRELLGQAMHPAKQPNLFVIDGGPQVANPTPLLASPSMEALLSYLSAQGQMTLLDAPPVLGVADVSVLVPRVDGVVLVVRQGHTKREQVLAALRQLQASRAHVVGTVLLQKNGNGWEYGQ